MINVYVGIPSRTKGYWSMYQGLLANVMNCAQHGINVAIDPKVGCSLICRARQDMTHKFLFENPVATHFFQLDDDVQLPPDAIYKLVSADKDIIAGMYPHKDNRGTIPIRGFDTFKVQDLQPEEIVEVAYLSTGCLMQKREFVQKMWDSYEDLSYEANITSGDKDRRALYMPYIHDKEYLSEDWAYCQRALDIGTKIYLHSGVKCPHWG
jgi:hypothetical protein